MHMDVAALGAASLGAEKQAAGLSDLAKAGIKSVGSRLFGSGAKAVAKAAPQVAGAADDVTTAAMKPVQMRMRSKPSAPGIEDAISTAPSPTINITQNAAKRSAPAAAAAPAASSAPSAPITPPTPGAPPVSPSSLGAASAGAAKAPRSFASRLGRTAAATTAVGGAAVGAGHANNAIQEWGMDPYERYRHHDNVRNQLTQELEMQIADATARRDHKAVQELVSQLDSPDLGASAFSLGGLNPWAEAGAGSHVDAMRDARTDAATKYTDAVNAHTGQRTKMVGDSTNERNAINQQIASIQSRLSSPSLLPQQRQTYQAALGNLQQSLKDYESQSQTALSQLGAESADAARIKQQALEAGMVGPGENFPGPGPIGAASTGAASATPGQPTLAPGIPRATPDPISTPAPNSNPLLVGGASNSALTPVNFRQVPKW